MSEDLMTFAEAAEYMHIKLYTLNQLVQKGQLPIFRINRRARFVSQKDADAYLKSCRVVKNIGG